MSVETLRQRLAAATKAPWEYWSHVGQPQGHGKFQDQRFQGVRIDGSEMVLGNATRPTFGADCELIAHGRQDLEALLAFVDAFDAWNECPETGFGETAFLTRLNEARDALEALP